MTRCRLLHTGPGNWGEFDLPVLPDGTGDLDDGWPDAVQAFTAGQCHAFAHSMHKLTGWPLAVLADHDEFEVGDYWDHMVVLSPGGGYVDIEGWHDEPEGYWSGDSITEIDEYILDDMQDHGMAFARTPEGNAAADAYARAVLERLRDGEPMPYRDDDINGRWLARTVAKALS